MSSLHNTMAKTTDPQLQAVLSHRLEQCELQLREGRPLVQQLQAVRDARSDIERDRRSKAKQIEELTSELEKCHDQLQRYDA
eukprot:8054040-Prorocentrum_lima.AAC.1